MFVLAMALTGCSQDEAVFQPDEKAESMNRIESMVAGFLSSTRSEMETGNIEIVSVTTKYFDESGEEVVSGARTRGWDSEDVFPLSTVVFTDGNETGYCLLSEDTRLEDVYFFTMEGNVSDTLYNEPLRDYLRAVPRMAASELSGESFSGSIVEARNISPLVKYKWGQGYPFNYVNSIPPGDINLTK